VSPAIEGVLVVVPAHDEEQEIDGCLRSTAAALTIIGDGVRRHVVVVDDGSTDATPEAAADALTEEAVPHDIVSLSGGNVGRARDRGFDVGMRRLVAAGVRPDAIWCMTTDADCRPIPAWVATHLAWADRGADAVAGLVAVRDWDLRHPRAADRWHRLVSRDGCGDGHRHVHGANLGWRGSAGVAVGGIPHLAAGEDHALWERLRAGGWDARSIADVGVTTSARRSRRAPGGFSSLLDLLEAGPGAAWTPTPVPVVD